MENDIMRRLKSESNQHLSLSCSLSLRTVQKRASEGCFCAFHWRTQGKDKVILSVNLFILSFSLYLSLSLHVSSSALSAFWCILFTGKKKEKKYIKKIHNPICVCENAQNRKKAALIIPGDESNRLRERQTWRPFNDRRGLAGMRRHCVKLLAFQSGSAGNARICFAS